MKRYLFLDMDDVLTSSDYMFGPRRPIPQGDDFRSPYEMIDPETIPRLNAIVEPTGALVVISSSWRQVHPLGFIANAMVRHGFKGTVVGKTGYRSDGDSGTRRGLEIQDWLDRASPVAQPRFVILDDDSDMGPLAPRLVKTTWQRGLLDEHVSLALKILETP